MAYTYNAPGTYNPQNNGKVQSYSWTDPNMFSGQNLSNTGTPQASQPASGSSSGGFNIGTSAPSGANQAFNYKGIYSAPSTVGSQSGYSYVAQPNPADKFEGFQLSNYPGTVANQRAGRAAMLGSQDQRYYDWINRYAGALQNQETTTAMNQRLQEELGIPQMRRNAFNLQAQLEGIPETYANAARGFDVNANQLARIQSTKAAQIAPAAQKATSQLQFASEQLPQLMGLYQQQQQKELSPYMYEQSYINDRIARETSGFDTDNENELNALYQRDSSGIRLTEAEKDRKLQLEMQKREFENQKALSQMQIDANKDLYKSGWS